MHVAGENDSHGDSDEGEEEGEGNKSGIARPWGESRVLSDDFGGAQVAGEGAECACVVCRQALAVDLQVVVDAESERAIVEVGQRRPENGGSDNAATVRLEEIGAHASDVANVIPNIICDGN